MSGEIKVQIFNSAKEAEQAGLYPLPYGIGQYIGASPDAITAARAQRIDIHPSQDGSCDAQEAIVTALATMLSR